MRIDLFYCKLIPTCLSHFKMKSPSLFPPQQAVTAIAQLLSASSLQSAIKNDLFPSAAMVTALSREVGVPLTKSELLLLDPHSHEAAGGAGAGAAEEARADPEMTARRFHPVRRGRGRWTPTEHRNSAFERHLLARKDHSGPRFLASNRAAIQRVSEANSAAKAEWERQHGAARFRLPEAFSARSDGVFNYSGQALNSGQLALKELSRFLHEKDPHGVYTFRPNGLDCVFDDQEDEKTTGERRPAEDWQHYSHLSSLESFRQGLPPLDGARAEELAEPWRENWLRQELFRPCLKGRSPLPWSARSLDFDLWRRPEADSEPIAPFYTARDDRHDLELAERQEANEWHRRVVVDDPQFRVHRRLAASEMTPQGLKAASQSERLTDILKDAPVKASLRGPGRFHDIPRLCVLHE